MKEQKYVIGINHNSGVWFYVGTTDHEGHELDKVNRYSSLVIDAKFYDDRDEAEHDAREVLPKEYVKWVMAVYDCPECGKKYVGYPALSRKDNKTKICPDCGVKEAIEMAMKGSK